MTAPLPEYTRDKALSEACMGAFRMTQSTGLRLANATRIAEREDAALLAQCLGTEEALVGRKEFSAEHWFHEIELKDLDLIGEIINGIHKILFRAPGDLELEHSYFMRGSIEGNDFKGLHIVEDEDKNKGYKATDGNFLEWLNQDGQSSVRGLFALNGITLLKELKLLSEATIQPMESFIKSQLTKLVHKGGNPPKVLSDFADACQRVYEEFFEPSMKPLVKEVQNKATELYKSLAEVFRQSFNQANNVKDEFVKEILHFDGGGKLQPVNKFLSEMWSDLGFQSH